MCKLLKEVNFAATWRAPLYLSSSKMCTMFTTEDSVQYNIPTLSYSVWSRLPSPLSSNILKASSNCFGGAVNTFTKIHYNKSYQLKVVYHLQCRPLNSGSVNLEVLLIQTGDYGPC